MTTPVYLSWGFGWESTAILLRWLTDATSRDFDLEQLTVLSAQVGSEFLETTIVPAQKHIIPLLRQHRVRFVQVARSGPHEQDGITILDDSCAPRRLFHEGKHRLETELLENGTVPTRKLPRTCSLKYKGWVMDRFIQADTNGAAYRHIIGFNCEEQRRIERDRSYAGAGRVCEYPLQAWGWDRARCGAYLREQLGVHWHKSACHFCPFAGGNADVMARYRTEPAAAARALLVEFVALCLNEHMNLFGPKKSLWSCIQADANAAALSAFDGLLQDTEWAVYRVRRLFHPPARRTPRPTPSTKGSAQRSVQRLFSGSLSSVQIGLEDMARKQGKALESGAYGRSLRLTVLPRGPDYSRGNAEEFYVLAPATVRDKEPPSFARNWDRLRSTLDLFDTAA